MNNILFLKSFVCWLELINYFLIFKILPVLSSLSLTDLDIKSTSKVILSLSSPLPNIFNFKQLLLINFALGNSSPTDYEFGSSDINLDGDIDVLDIVLLVNIILDN